jgi:hypothetical protein
MEQQRPKARQRATDQLRKEAQQKVQPLVRLKAQRQGVLKAQQLTQVKARRPGQTTSQTGQRQGKGWQRPLPLATGLPRSLRTPACALLLTVAFLGFLMGP